jgi:mannose-6-phosphate isomerase
MQYNQIQAPLLASCDYFTSNILYVQTQHAKDSSNLDSFVIFMCVEGNVKLTAGLHTETLKMGETVLLPATTEEVLINSKNGKLLDVFL